MRIKNLVIGTLSIWFCLAGLLFYSSPLLALDCTPDSITLSTQAEVDSFQTDHGPGCDTIVSDLTVDGLSITDLTPLSGLTTGMFTSTIKIQNTSITSLAGLSGLTSVYWIEITGNNVLTSLTALSTLANVSGPLFIQNNAVLANVNGLNNLTSLTGGALIVEGNAALTDLSGVSGITNIAASLSISNNDALTNLDSLSGLTTVAASVHVSDNASITSLSGLSGLVGFTAALNIRRNSSLTSIGDLTNMTDLDGLVILGNDALSSLDGLSGLTNLGNATSLAILSNNSLTNIDALAGVLSAGFNVEVIDNPALSLCSALQVLLDQVDDDLPGPGPGGAGIPDVGGDVTISDNLEGCNSVEEILGEVTPVYTVGGSIMNLSGEITLQNNATDDLSTSANGNFSFATALNDNSNYVVTVMTQPIGQNCLVSNSSGTIAAADVTDVIVNCTDDVIPPVEPPPATTTPIPTLGNWSLLLLSILMGLMFVRYRRLN